MAFNFQPRGVSGTGQPDAGSGLGAGMYRPGRPAYSEQVSAYNRGFGSAANGGRGDTAQEKRPFKLVGKNTVNLLDPGAQEREQQRLYADYGIEPVKHEGFFGPVQDYFDPSTPGGLISGLLGALGQTVGGVFGDEAAQGGAEVGGFIGKLPESVMGVVGSVGLPDVFVPYIDQANAEIEKSTPYLMRDTIRLPTNLGGVVMSMLNGMGLLGRAVERTYAGFDERGGMPESIAARVESGELTRDEGLDEMVMQGLGFSDDPWHNMALSMVTDPFNWFTLGVGAVGASARGGIRLAEMVNRSGRLLNAVEHGARLGALGDRVRAGQVVRYEDIQNLSRPELRRARMTFGRAAVAESKTNPVMKLGTLIKLKMVPSATEVLGPIPDVTSNLFYKTAQTVIRNTDPFTFLGGRLFGTGNVGKRSMEYMAVASTAAVYSAFDPMNVRALADLANDVTGGEDILMEALGVGGGNVLQEFALAEHVADGLRAGMVPVLSDSAGKSLSSTEAARSLLRGGAFDTNIGKHMEVQTIRNQPALFVRRADEASEAMTHSRVLAESREKLSSMLGPGWNPERLTAGHLNEKMASLIHFAYYYRKGATFHNEVVPVLVAAGSAGTLPAGMARDMSRLTLVAERTLTKGRAVAIRAAVVAKDAETVRDLVSQYKNFDWLKAHQMDAPDLLRTIEGWLDTNEATLLDEVDFIDPATGARYAGLPKELEDWLADADAGFGYRLAEAPPDNIPRPDLYGAVRDENGMLMGMSPWLDFLANPARDLGGTFTPSRPSLMAAYQSRVFGRVRQERIRWESQRRFITDMSKGTDNGGMDVSPALSEKLWRGLMQESERQRLQPRGLAPQDIAGLIHRTLEEAKSVHDGLSMQAEHLTERQVTNALLRATRGDLWTVGLTQRATGAAKARLPGAGSNFWGQISEKLFPMVRFTLNPVFQLQELLEPYILNRMRGVAAPLDRNSPKFKEALATHNAIMQLVRTSFEPDGMMAESAEYLKLYAADFLGTRQAFGANSWWGRVASKFTPGIQERKAALASLEAKQLFGERFRRSIDEMYGPEEGARRWREMEQDALSVDKGEVAMRWMATNMHLSNQHGESVTQVHDLLNDHTFGAQLRVTHSMSPGAITFGDLERHIDGVRQNDAGFTGVLFKDRRNAAGGTYHRGEALVAHLKSISQADWMLEAKTLRGIVVHNEAARTIWLMGNGKAPEVFWREYRGGYLQNVRGTTRPATRKARDAALVFHRQLVANVFAPAAGLTEAEYIARYLNPTNSVLVVPSGAPYPLGARLDMREDWPEEVLKRDGPNVFSTRTTYVGRDDNWSPDAEKWEAAFDDEDEYVFAVLETQRLFANARAGQNVHTATAFNDAAEVLERQRNSPDFTLVRLNPKKYPVKETSLGNRYPRKPVSLNDVEVLDADSITWVRVGDIPPPKMAQEAPPLGLAPADVDKLYVNRPAVGPAVQAEPPVVVSADTLPELRKAQGDLWGGQDVGQTLDDEPVRHLGGTTGADLVRVPYDNRQYVQKTGTSPEHIEEEFNANQVYQRLGVPVPKTTLIHKNGELTQRANYIKGEALNEWVRHHSPDEVQDMYDQLAEGFALDALLANWDAMGLEGDNIIVSNGLGYRVDNGGSLRFRAQGQPKTRFGNTVGELNSLRDPDVNEWGSVVYGQLSDGDIRRQVLNLEENRAHILNQLPTDMWGQINARLDDMLAKTKGVTPTPVATPRVLPQVPVTVGDDAVAGIYPVDVEAMLGHEHQGARSTYKGPEYELINSYLRGLPYNGSEYMDVDDLDAVIEDIDGLIAKGALAEDTPIYRGIVINDEVKANYYDFTTAAVGDVIPPDPAFMSWSDDESRAENFAMSGGTPFVNAGGTVHVAAMIHMTAPAGSRYGYILGGERELLGPRGQGMQVVAHTVSTSRGWRGQPVELHTVTVTPTNNGRLPGVKQLAVEDLTAAQTVPHKLARDAMLNPEQLRADTVRWGLSDEGTAAVEEAIAKAEQNKPNAWGFDPLVDEALEQVQRAKPIRPEVSGWNDEIEEGLRRQGALDVPERAGTIWSPQKGVLIAYDDTGHAVGQMAYTERGVLNVLTSTPRAGVATRLYDEAYRLSGDEFIRAIGLTGMTPKGKAFATSWLSQRLIRPVDRTPEASFADDIAALTDDEIGAAVTGIADLRLRLEDVGGGVRASHRLMRAMAIELSTGRGIRMGWKEIVRVMEDLWRLDPTTSTAEIQRAIFKGARPTGQEPLTAAERDALDVMLGNTSRGSVGRGETQNPVLVDEFNMLDAGYAPGTAPNEYNHEYVVDFYNRKAAHANDIRFRGASDWTASEMALLGSRRYQKLARVNSLSPGEEIQQSYRSIPVGVKGLVDPNHPIGEMHDLLDLYFKWENREQLQGLLDELGTTIGQELRDKMGLPVLAADGSGVNIMAAGGTRSHMPVIIVASDDRLNDAADAISYMTGQARVWSYRPTEVTETTDLMQLIPRVVIRVPAQNGDQWTKQYAVQIGNRLQRDGFTAGVTAVKKANGDWELSIMDDEGKLGRHTDGRVVEENLDEMIETALAGQKGRNFPNLIDPQDPGYGIEYGTVYKAGPKSLGGQKFDWDGHRARTQELLQSRGSRLTGEDLDDLRSTYGWAWQQRVERDAPKQVRRWRGGEPLVPGRLEDRRSGTVRGYTDIDATGQATLGAVGAPDELTGVHELMHIFGHHLDSSAKQRVIDLYNDWRTAARGNMATRIADADARAAAARSPSTRRRWQNKSNAMRHELGSIGNEVDWGPEHEEFLVQQFMDYIDNGRSPNPEMTNVIQHFRTYTQNLRNELHPPNGPQVPFSPEMETFFNRVLKKSMRDKTFPYSVEQETLRMAAKQQLRDAWDEAHGTHYYRKDRSWLERSVNHPYIGVYPSSYMWGKVLPEMFRFLALRPFGYETPFLAWNVAREVSDTMRYQSETNDDFREYLSTNERAFMLANMMFPALPADIPANISLPVRRIAEQGLMNQLKFSRGVKYGDKRGEVHAVDYLSGLEDAVNYAIGPLGFARTAGEVGEMAVGVGQTLLGQGEEEEEAALPRSPFSAGRAEQ